MPALELDRAAWLEVRSKLPSRAAAAPRLLVAAFDLACVTAAISCSLQAAVWARILAVALSTLALLHAYLLHHECVHRTLFRDDRLNRAFGHLFGFVLLYPFLPRRRSHIVHHLWPADAVGDPVNRRAIARFSSFSPRALRVLDRLWRCWVPFLALNERIGLWTSSLSEQDGQIPSRTERCVSLVFLALYASLLLLALTAARWRVPLLVYGSAMLLVLFLEELINLPHHLETPLERRGRPQPLWKQHQSSSSCRDVLVWSRWILLHFNLHAAHHLYPDLPWHALPHAQRELERMGLGTASESELSWSLKHRRRPFQLAFAQYLGGTSGAPAYAGVANRMTGRAQ